MARMSVERKSGHWGPSCVRPAAWPTCRQLPSKGDGGCAEIESVHVHPDHRGSGVRGAHRRPSRAARPRGCYRVQLTSNAARPDAHRFYERLVPSLTPRRRVSRPKAAACSGALRLRMK